MQTVIPQPTGTLVPHDHLRQEVRSNEALQLRVADLERRLAETRHALVAVYLDSHSLLVRFRDGLAFTTPRSGLVDAKSLWTRTTGIGFAEGWEPVEFSTALSAAQRDWVEWLIDVWLATEEGDDIVAVSRRLDRPGLTREEAAQREAMGL